MKEAVKEYEPDEVVRNLHWNRQCIQWSAS